MQRTKTLSATNSKEAKTYVNNCHLGKHENYLRQVFYKENTFWTDGYFVSSVGNVSQETIKKYIENQG